MGDMDKIIANINVVTGKLRYEQIQDLLLYSRRYKKSTEHNEIDNWNRVSEILWCHLNKGLDKLDDQLLCTTGFFSVLIFTDQEIFYIKKVHDIIEKELNYRSTTKPNSNSFVAVSLMYGIFQSSFLTQINKKSDCVEVIQSIFYLLILMGYEYSQYTSIAFKIINTFKKICGTDLQEVIFNEHNQIKLLNLINHNWENPITGVRDLNKEIFQTILTILDEHKLSGIVDEIDSFYWNKAKYLMLSEIIHNHNGDMISFIMKYNILDGLINSLHKPGLVSAGTDIYFAILNKIQSEDMWCKIFLSDVIEVLNGSSSKAIENFTNYWCLRTFKQFPTLMNTLIEELQKIDDTESTLYSVISLLKQGSKIGILNIDWDVTDNNINSPGIVLRAIEHYNAQIRTLAFDVICHSQGKTLPSQKEYGLILEYIRNNINSDCTVLRINMLNSFDAFLGQLHVLFRNIKDGQNTDEKISLLSFFNKLQGFVIKSMNLNGNYQRRSTNVKLIKIIINCVNEVPRKKKNYAKVNGIALREYLEINKCWILNDKDFLMKLIGFLKDPSDDIRANVGNLLYNNYFNEMRHTVITNTLIQNAMQSMKSKFFFEISCGQSMFQLLVNLLLKEKHHEAIFKSIEDVFNYSIKELFKQYNMKQNVLKSIEDGKQLHSFISILQVVLEVSIKSSYKLDVTQEDMSNLLDVLQGITEQFTFEQQNSTSSDFSKMNEVVEDIIAKGGTSHSIEKDQTKISGLHQIVLNCLWLNVKASCDLSSLLIRYHKDDIQKCEKCLTTITHVLETSRHKGAIEAAGSSLGRGIQFLTALPEDSKVSELPQTLLKTKLHTLILEASKMASITRRGAGLSIMVHRIVSSDMRKGKPLFHYFIQTLLTTCQETKDIPTLEDKKNIENQMDLPKAILIHFLSRIVTDSSLASDMMFYSAELAELAFSNLTSPHWQIRNAALQLYGALIPKLIGQRKPSGMDDEIIATVAYDELRTHSPKLWQFITEQLAISHTDKINSHSNLVPILNMLASCAKRYNFSDDLREQTSAEKELLSGLLRVLDSPIHTVRRLASKCIFNIFTFLNIYDAIITMDFKSENLLHGVLQLLKNCRKYYNLRQNSDMQEKFQFILQNKKCSYWTKEVYASIYPDNLRIEYVQDILTELQENSSSPGVFLWAQTCIKNCVLNSQWDDIPKVLDQLLKHKNLEMCCDILLLKLDSQGCDSDAALMQITCSLLSSDCLNDNGVIWQILYEISQLIDLNDIDFIKVINVILSFGGDTPCSIKYIIPFTVRYIKNFDNELQKYLADIIYKLGDFESMDVDMRCISALANNELASSFNKLSHDVKITSVKTAIMLLQDEDEDVRNLSVNYYKNIQNLEVAVHPAISLSKMLDYTFLYNILDCNEKVIHLCDDLLQVLANNVHSTIDEYNPFANDSKNIYLEVDVLRASLEYLKLVASCQ